MTRTLLQQALGALHPQANRAFVEATKDALRSALAAPQPEPVALESVHLTRDTQGMCVVRVNGRVAIRDNGDIIDHMATLEWFAAPPAAPAMEAEQCYCDRVGIGVPGVSCGDCPRDYTPPAIDGFGGNLDEAFDVPSNQLSGNSGALTLIPPAGMVMVPREATQAMCAAAVVFANGNAVYKNVLSEVLKLEESIYAEVYEAMIAAAPAPAVPADAAMTLLKELRHALEPISAYGRVGTRDVEQAKLQHLVAMIDRVLSAAPAVREPKPAELLGMAVVDAIVDDGMRNAAGGIYATRVQEFAREVQIAFAQQNRVDLSGIGGGGK